MWETHKKFAPRIGEAAWRPSGASDEPISSWPYFQSMLFLTDQFIPRKSSGNLASKDDNEEVMSGLSDDEQQNNDPEPVVNTDNEVEPLNEPPFSASTSHAISVSSNLPTNKDSKMVNSVVTKTGYIKRVTPQTVIGQHLSIQRSTSSTSYIYSLYENYGNRTLKWSFFIYSFTYCNTLLLWNLLHI